MSQGNKDGEEIDNYSVSLSLSSLFLYIKKKIAILKRIPKYLRRVNSDLLYIFLYCFSVKKEQKNFKMGPHYREFI